MRFDDDTYRSEGELCGELILTAPEGMCFERGEHSIVHHCDGETGRVNRYSDFVEYLDRAEICDCEDCEHENKEDDS